jgi:alpha/beta superfamily hydrolase
VSSILTADGLALEALWDDPSEASIGVVVFCHPHPLDGGTMKAPLMERVAAEMSASGIHVLRFNFRGVGKSEGSWGGGLEETHDVAAAIEAARLAFADLPLGITGWSFGASTSLRWQIDTRSELPWVGIAPGIRSYRGSQVPQATELQPADRLIILGDRDQFASVDDMRVFADEAGAALEVLSGSDHFFYFREDIVGGLVASHFKSGFVSD